MKGHVTTVEGGALHGLLCMSVQEGTLDEVLAESTRFPGLRVVSFTPSSQVAPMTPAHLANAGFLTRFVISDEESTLDMPGWYVSCNAIRVVTSQPRIAPFTLTELVYETTLPAERVPFTRLDAWKILRVKKKPRKVTEYLEFLQSYPDWRIEGPGFPIVKVS